MEVRRDSSRCGDPKHKRDPPLYGGLIPALTIIACVLSAAFVTVFLFGYRKSVATKEAAWRAMAGLLDYSGIRGRLVGKLDDFLVRVHRVEGECSIAVHPESSSLRDMEFTTGVRDSFKEHVATGDAVFDRKFNVVGDTRAIYSTLGVKARLHLINFDGPITLKDGALRTHVRTMKSPNEMTALLHNMVEATKALTTPHYNAALFRNMTHDPIDDVRIGAFEAALRVPDLREEAIKRAAESRWPELRLRASDVVRAHIAVDLLLSVIKSAPSAMRCDAIRRASKRHDVDVQLLVSAALTTKNMSVMKTLHELGIDVSEHLELIRQQIDACAIDPRELIVLFVPHIVAADCGLLLRTLERYPSNTALIAPALSQHGGPGEAQRLHAIASNPGTGTEDRRTLQKAAKKIATRAAARGGGGRLGIAVPAREGAVALAQNERAPDPELVSELVDSRSRRG